MSAYILDLDGTIYRGKQILPYAQELIDFFEKEEYPYLFFTNSPENSPENIAEKMNAIGVSAKPEHIVTSGMMAISYLAEHTGSSEKRINILGSHYVKKLAEMAGFLVTDEAPDCVLAACDGDIRMRDIQKASLQVAQGAKFFATNPDDTIPEAEWMIPHTGTILYAIEQASGQSPLIIGKPSGLSSAYFTQKFQCPAPEIRMVGDRLDTDMQFARNCGFKGYLMLTGITSKQQAEQASSDYDCCFEHLRQLIQYDKQKGSRI